MTFFLDADYSQKSRPDEVKLSDELTYECKKRGVDFVVKDLNTLGYGDCMFVGLDGVYSAEIKKAGEFVGDTEHCVQQIKKQLPNANYTNLFIYGEAYPSPDGKSYEYNFKSEKLYWERHPDAQAERIYRRRYYNVNWQGQRKILWRMRQEGINVVECRNLTELAFELCTWYEAATTVGTTFSRLEVEKFQLNERDTVRRDFMLTLMGIQNAGVGPETADAITSWLERMGCPLNMYSLILAQAEGAQHIYGNWSELSSQPLSSSLLPGARKRTVGPAVVTKLRKAFGL